MNLYNQEIELYFELKGTPDSSRESYHRRMRSFLTFLLERNRPVEEMNERDIQQYILYLKLFSHRLLLFEIMLNT